MWNIRRPHRCDDPVRMAVIPHDPTADGGSFANSSIEGVRNTAIMNPVKIGLRESPNMLNIYVDGDACPVKDEVVRVATRCGLEMYLVSNNGVRLPSAPNLHAVLVGGGFDAADHWIVEHVAASDIVITSDIQLAARCLEKGASVLGPNGRPFTEEQIGSDLAMRELNAYLRDTGEIRGHNPSFTKKDRSKFLQALDTLIQKLRK